MLFYGECHVEVESKTPDAHIMVDGVMLGHDKVSANLPCGEKEIYVIKHGYLPFQEYIPVTKGQPLVVRVELRKVEKAPDYALSSELIDQVRNGKPLENPWEMKFRRAGLIAAKSPEASVPLSAPAKASGLTPAPVPGVPRDAGAAAAGGDTEEDWR